MALETDSMERTGWVLACDGGATGLRAGLYDTDGRMRCEATAGPCNPVEEGVSCVAAKIAALARTMDAGAVGNIAAGIAGAARLPVRNALALALARALSGTRVRVTDDLHPALLANAADIPAILVIAGTGSSVLAWYPGRRGTAVQMRPFASGRSGNDTEVRIGGRGRLFGDDGSGYAVAVAAMRAAARMADGTGAETRLLTELPRAIDAAAFDDMVLWSAQARKSDVAHLACTVDRLAVEGDRVALQCIEKQAEYLVEQTLAARDHLALPDTASVLLTGGLFDGSALFRHTYRAALAACWPAAKPVIAPIRGHAAACHLARLDEPLPAWISQSTGGTGEPILATEQALEGVPPLDTRTAREIVEMMNAEDACVAQAVHAVAGPIARVIDMAAEAFRTGGRLIYAGAGTSGRLGVLDASECPATFGTPHGQVVALIAGGENAIRYSVEGAEDDETRARADIEALQPPVGPHDVVVGIAASGRTPYVHAALAAARSGGARTALVACNAVACNAADVVIAIETGMEVLAGSTRLKAGTATKMVLNMISTGSMALSGRVFDGLMIGMHPVNAKLRRRAEHIVAVLAPCEPAQARAYLEITKGDIAVAVLMARTGVDADTARVRLAAKHGHLRAALEEC